MPHGTPLFAAVSLVPQARRHDLVAHVAHAHSDHVDQHGDDGDDGQGDAHQVLLEEPPQPAGRTVMVIAAGIHMERSPLGPPLLDTGLEAVSCMCWHGASHQRFTETHFPAPSLGSGDMKIIYF